MRHGGGPSTSTGPTECGVCWCSCALRCDDQQMDMMTMGLMGTVVGASAVGIAGVAKSAADNLLPGMVGNLNNKHQTRIHLHTRRCDDVQRWRTGLAEARDSYRQWECGPRSDAPPNVVGDEWFEGLRPHLPVHRRSGEIPHCARSSLRQSRLSCCSRSKSDGSKRSGQKRRRAAGVVHGTGTDTICSARHGKHSRGEFGTAHHHVWQLRIGLVVNQC